MRKESYRPTHLSNAELRQAEELGGYDDPREYIDTDKKQYCDKGCHRERSLYHAPQHARHWKKVERAGSSAEE